MKKIYWLLIIIILGFLGYWAFSLGWILLKVFIGLMFVAVFAFGVWIGHITTKK
jgi:hypothetical protein